MKHTPGTWKSEVWDYTLTSPPRKELTITTDKFRIAFLECDFSGNNPFLIPQEEAMANARLIAAAPELAETVHDLLLMLYQYLPASIKLRGGKGTIKKAESLLAKIEGNHE